MKLMDKINNIGVHSKGKIIITSCLVIIFVMVSYFLINFFTTDYAAQVPDPLSGKTYTTLNEFRKNGIKFTEIENVLNKIFDYSKDINVNKLVKLCKKIESTFFTIMDLNGINENEVKI